MESFQKRFTDGLLNYGLTYEDLKKFKYHGGDFASHKNYLKQFFPEEVGIYPNETTCVCGHDIKNNCYLATETEVLVIGSCCIKRFLPSQTGRVCVKCDAPHSNRKVNMCNYCKTLKYCEGCDKEIQKRFTFCWSCNNKNKS